MDAIREKCKELAAVLEPVISNALRAEMRKSGMAHEQYFLGLVTPGDDRISHAALCKRVTSLLGGDAAKPEQLGLLCQSIEADGISRRKFQASAGAAFVPSHLLFCRASAPPLCLTHSAPFVFLFPSRSLEVGLLVHRSVVCELFVASCSIDCSLALAWHYHAHRQRRLRVAISLLRLQAIILKVCRSRVVTVNERGAVSSE